MMQMYPILMVAVILAADGGLAVAPPGDAPSGWIALLLATGPVLGILALTWPALAWCMHRMARRGSPRAIVTADRLVRLARWLVLANHAGAVLIGGWLHAVRARVGDPILLDEVLALLPALLGAVALWWVHYPVERRVREAMLIRRLDLGQPIHAMPRRWRYVLQQTKLNLLLLLVPILIIVGLSECVRWLLDRPVAARLPSWTADASTFLVGLGVFLCAPLLARMVLNLRPLDDGPVRDDLMDICRRHRVRIRHAFLWQTDGTMINAAVMGLLGRLRYVLMTDALIETLTRDQVQAVMAHEIGHVRRHHMSWLVTSLIASLLGAIVVVTLPFVFLRVMGVDWNEPTPGWFDALVTVLAAALALSAFGWLSRRYERQADTFAVQHLSRLQAERAGEEATMITAEAVAAMNGALGAIAGLNAIDRHRRSWRHGSIAWRQGYLASLVGRPADGLPVDQLVRRLKLAAALVLIFALLGVGGLELAHAPVDSPAPSPSTAGPPEPSSLSHTPRLLSP